MTDAAAAPAPIDAGHLDDLVAVLDEETVDRLVAALIADLAVTPRRIAALIAAGDAAAARHAAHRLRGAASGLGCIGVATLAGEIESSRIEFASAGDLVDVAAATITALTLRSFKAGAAGVPPNPLG